MRLQLSYIGKDLNDPATETWVPNALSLVQAVLGPLISSASDTFQARKILLVATCTVSFVGAAIAPGSNSMARLITAQTLIGFGFAAVPLAYAVPSEILPRKWRPGELQLHNVTPNRTGLTHCSGTRAAQRRRLPRCVCGAVGHWCFHIGQST